MTCGSPITDSIYLFVFLSDSGSEVSPSEMAYGSFASRDNDLDFVYSPTYIRFLVGNRAPALPDWFSVGMTRLYGANQFRCRSEGLVQINGYRAKP